MLIPAEMPAAGHRARTPPLHGSSDALAIARLARARRPLAVFTATAADAQRLLEELPFFDPALKVHLFPDWETLPYDQLSPHHDLVSERLATLYQLMQRALDVAIVPVTTALYRLRAGRISRRPLVPLQAGRAPRARGAAQPARDRRLRARHAGRRARRILRARRADRPLSHGQRAALPHRARRRRSWSHPQLRRRHPALASTR